MPGVSKSSVRLYFVSPNHLCGNVFITFVYGFTKHYFGERKEERGEEREGGRERMRDREGGREGTILQSYYKDTVYSGKPLKEKCFYELQIIRKIYLRMSDKK